MRPAPLVCRMVRASVAACSGDTPGRSRPSAPKTSVTTVPGSAEPSVLGGANGGMTKGVQNSGSAPRQRPASTVRPRTPRRSRTVTYVGVSELPSAVGVGAVVEQERGDRPGEVRPGPGSRATGSPPATADCLRSAGSRRSRPCRQPLDPRQPRRPAAAHPPHLRGQHNPNKQLWPTRPGTAERRGRRRGQVGAALRSRSAGDAGTQPSKQSPRARVPFWWLTSG